MPQQLLSPPHARSCSTTMLLVVLTCLFVSLHACECDTNAVREGLNSFYVATGGATTWKTAQVVGWVDTSPEVVCAWTGVTCKGNGSLVTKITLEDVGLSGTIPAGLLVDAFPALETLSLKHNQLSGSVPASIAQLTMLEDLVLTGNSLSGSIPAELQTLVRLMDVSLDGPGNTFTGAIPNWIGALPELRTLRLSAANLSPNELPSSWGALSRLKRCELRGVSGTLPATWSSMRSLEVLSIDSSPGLMGTLPDALFAEMSNLSTLRIAGPSALEGSMPSSISRCTKLKILSLQDNRFVGTISPAWSSLTTIQFVYVHNNRIHGELPSVFGEAWKNSIEVLSLNGNMLSGTVPVEWCRMRRLTTLWLFDNRITGPLPDPNPESSMREGGWTQLKDISLDHNPLQATLPSAWGSMMPNITTVSFTNASLVGTIPDTWGLSWTRCYRMMLGTNQLVGTVPQNFQHLVELETLWLPNNQLSGPLPDFLGSLTKLDDLVLSKNHFTGTLPLYFADLHALRLLRILGNNISGTLPPQWGVGLPNIVVIDLSQNHLHGTIPPSWGEMRLLQHLSLNGNADITGTIPKQFGNLASIQSLFFGFCNLTGTLPPELHMATKLIHLVFSFNRRLCGSLPSQWSSLRKLESLLLDHTSIGGSIPTSYSALAALGGVGSLTLLGACDTELCGSPSPLALVGWVCVNATSGLPFTSETIPGMIEPMSQALPICTTPPTPAPNETARPNRQSNRTVVVLPINSAGTISASVGGLAVAMVVSPGLGIGLTRAARVLELAKQCSPSSRNEDDDRVDAATMSSLYAAALGYALSIVATGALIVACSVALLRRAGAPSSSSSSSWATRLEAFCSRWGVANRCTSAMEVLAPSALDAGLGIVVLVQTSSAPVVGSSAIASDDNVALGAIALALGLLVLLWLSCTVSLFFSAKWQPEAVHEGDASAGRQQRQRNTSARCAGNGTGCIARVSAVSSWLDAPCMKGAWVASPPNPRRSAKRTLGAMMHVHRALFEDCKPRRFWYMALETSLSLIVSGVGGVGSAGAGSCGALLAVAAAVQTLGFVLLVVLRPYLTRWVTGSALFLSAGSAITAILSTIPGCESCVDVAAVFGEVDLWVALVLGVAGSSIRLRLRCPKRPPGSGLQKANAQRQSRSQRRNPSPRESNHKRENGRRLSFPQRWAHYSSQRENLTKLVTTICNHRRGGGIEQVQWSTEASAMRHQPLN